MGSKDVHGAEVLFQPSFADKKNSGFHDTSFQSNMKGDVYIRKESYTNAVSSGGTTMFQEIVERPFCPQHISDHMFLFFLSRLHRPTCTDFVSLHP